MAILVPKIFHRIWLGNPMPEQFERWGETWLRHHPGWTMKLWTEKNLPPSRYPDLIEKCRYYSARANLYRLEILLREGGVSRCRRAHVVGQMQPEPDVEGERRATDALSQVRVEGLEIHDPGLVVEGAPRMAPTEVREAGVSEHRSDHCA